MSLHFSIADHKMSNEPTFPTRAPGSPCPNNHTFPPHPFDPLLVTTSYTCAIGTCSARGYGAAHTYSPPPLCVMKLAVLCGVVSYLAVTFLLSLFLILENDTRNMIILNHVNP